MAKQPTKQELQERLARAERQNGAYFEWFMSTQTGEQAVVLDVEIEGEVQLRLHVRRPTRSCGGVVVLETINQDWFDAPQYVDDLVSRWLRDHSPYIREGARKLARYMSEANRPPSVAGCEAG